ncbi:MAG TPA: trypsin-like peptidase domain-containing protein [Gammaproteobacteria bacterium]
MKRLQKLLFFLFQSVTLGLAAAFVVVWLRPDLLNRINGLQQSLPAAATPASFRAAVHAAAPAVVNIHSMRAAEDSVTPWLDDASTFVPEDRIETTLGSGVIVNADGYILTNHHVIRGAGAFQIALADGRIAPATVVGIDPDTDLALLKIELDDLPVITLGRSDDVQVGDVVLAIGNPFGVGQTVTQGIVSATGRNYLGHATFENFIQTDAAINPGNSGGALVNARGEMIGVNSAIFSQSVRANGIGFAVPVSLARGVVNQIIEHGRVIRGWLGVDPQDVTPELAEAFGLEDDAGIIVRDVYRGSPAEAAGIERGDTITHINDNAVANAHEALTVIASTPPGETLRIRGIRRGQPFVTKAIIIERAPVVGS